MKSPRSSTIRASEIGTYLYCKRAWWFTRKGETSSNQAELLSGTQIHEEHGRTVLSAGLLRAAGYAVLLLALVLSVFYFVNLLV